MSFINNITERFTQQNEGLLIEHKVDIKIASIGYFGVQQEEKEVFEEWGFEFLVVDFNGDVEGLYVGAKDVLDGSSDERFIIDCENQKMTQILKIFVQLIIENKNEYFASLKEVRSA